MARGLPTRGAPELHLWPEPSREIGELVEIRARLEHPVRGPVVIWFRVPARHLDSVSESADPFVLAALFAAMRQGGRLRVHGRASPSLLANLERFQAVWHGWLPELYRPCAISAEQERELAPPDGDAALLAFSGGLDSSFTAWRHAREEAGRATRSVAAGVMVHGFDIPLDHERAFAAAAESSRSILDSVGVELITVACNLKQLGPELDMDWEDSHAAMLAACLHLFGKGRGTGLIASTHPYDELRFPWGSNPFTDPMLSTAAFEIVNDGGECSRADKAAVVAGWPEAMRRLRVCWQGPDKDRNCGECPTCVYTAVCFAVTGAEPPRSIPVGPLALAVRRAGNWPLTAGQHRVVVGLVQRARSAGIDDPWVDAADRAARAGRRWGRLEERVPWTAKPRQAWELLRSRNRRERLGRRVRGLGAPR